MQIPVAQGRYVPAVRHENLIFVSGMTPRRNGLLEALGPIDPTRPIETFRSAVELATCNAGAAARSLIEANERLIAAMSLTVFVNCPSSFTDHSRIADFASCYLEDKLDVELGARTAVGVSSLPGSAAVELSLVFLVGSSPKRSVI